MKRNTAFALYCLLILTGISGVKAQQVFKTTTQAVIAYLEYLPEDYGMNSDKYPVVIFLHGIGERGPDTTDPVVLEQYIQNVAKHGPPKHVKNGTKFPFILISPQLKNNYGDWPTAYILEVINHLKSYLRIDERRIYLTGLSLGGGGVWWAAQDIPALFAAIAPVCGGRNNPSLACGIAGENVPVWAFHGDKDTVVPLSRSQNMVNAINSCTPAPSPLAKLTIYEGVGHNAWDYAFRPDKSLHTPNVYEWLMSQLNIKNKGNKIPVANAGNDKTIYTSASVTGSGSDTDGSIVSYQWKKINGPSVSMSNENSSTLSLTNPPLGNYMFSLKVVDNNGNSDTDYVKVSVVKPPNVAPVAQAGMDKLVKLPTTSATICGSATDADGSVVSYSWTKISGSSCAMYNTTSSTLKLGGLASGSYVFRLTVKDNSGNTASDDMKIIVDAPPVVNAGSDKSVQLPLSSSIVLNGSATDMDGTITKYVWSKYSGPNVSVLNSGTSSLTITKLYEGTYIFKLAATDDLGVTGYDYVTITATASQTLSSRMSTYRSEPGTDVDISPIGEVATIRENMAIEKGREVIIYNENGKKVFSGIWSEESELEVIRKGLYYYNVIKDGRRVESGKIFKRDI